MDLVLSSLKVNEKVRFFFLNFVFFSKLLIVNGKVRGYNV